MIAVIIKLDAAIISANKNFFINTFGYADIILKANNITVNGRSK